MPDNTEKELLEKLEKRIHRFGHRIGDLEGEFLDFGVKIDGIGETLELLHTRFNLCQFLRCK